MTSSISRLSITGTGSGAGNVVARTANGSVDVPAGGAYTINGASVVTDTGLIIKEGSAPSAVASKLIVYFDNSDSSLKVKVGNGDVYALITQKII